ncbi:exodeoxyribonuclease VII small subunit [Uliginosibacterium gangwonense]|uniref:exodeoxyribonuclease VII small subunit n=1 Tax=Uliginosibacterium gangwonense TaxID=392736 RepID=UPI000363B40D|nr:exodeoxyribonuclease VII small subunit [Uliginosibacterium gangwonense]
MAKKEQTTTPASFEAAIAELESIVAAMERDDLPLEQALASYQRGIDLLRHCQGTLDSAEQRVKVLEQGLLREMNTGENGQEP